MPLGRVYSGRSLDGSDAVTQRQRDALGLGPDADVTAQLAIFLLLYRHVHKGIFAEHGSGVQVGCQEVRAIGL